MSFLQYKKSILLVLALLIGSLSTIAQTKWQSDTFRVAGNCSMCKKRIEEAAYIKGVKSADWNKTTKILTVVYSPAKAQQTQIIQAVLKAGHDAGTQRATDKHYNTLPDCCAYRTGTCND